VRRVVKSRVDCYPADPSLIQREFTRHCFVLDSPSAEVPPAAAPLAPQGQAPQHCSLPPPAGQQPRGGRAPEEYHSGTSHRHRPHSQPVHDDAQQVGLNRFVSAEKSFNIFSPRKLALCDRNLSYRTIPCIKVTQLLIITVQCYTYI